MPICQKPSGIVLKSPQLTISIKLITENFEYALKSVIAKRRISYQPK